MGKTMPKTKAVFEEDDLTLEMEVHAQGSFSSDGELDSQESQLTEDSPSESDAEGDVSDEQNVGQGANNNATVTTGGNRKSMEEKIDSLTSTLLVMHDLMAQRGFFSDGNRTDKQEMPDKQVKPVQTTVPNQSCLLGSGTTVYHNAIMPAASLLQEDTEDKTLEVVDKQRVSTSSEEEQMDSSGELIEKTDFNERFIADCE